MNNQSQQFATTRENLEETFSPRNIGSPPLRNKAIPKFEHPRPLPSRI